MGMSMVHKIEGKMVISESKFEYGVFSNRTMHIEYISISSILSGIFYNSPSSEVRIQISVYDLDKKEYIDIFDESGKLQYGKSEGVYDWFVGSHDLGKILFYNVDNRVNISIEDMDFSKYAEN